MGHEDNDVELSALRAPSESDIGLSLRTTSNSPFDELDQARRPTGSRGADRGMSKNTVLDRSAIRGELSSVVGKRENTQMGQRPGEVLVIYWPPGDPRAVFITFGTVLNCSSVAIMATWGPDRFNVSREAFELSFTVIILAISITPMALAPLSEVFGRNSIYQITSILNALLFLPQALSPYFAALLIVRWFQGMATSVGNSMVGGTIADLFSAADRGAAINVFSLVTFIAQSLGGVIFGWVAQYWGIQWCYGIQGIIAATSCVLNAFFLRETRPDVLLSRRAERLTKKTGIKHIALNKKETESFLSLVRVSIVRPFQFLLFEPIVSALSAWIGFAWAIVFLGGTSERLVFQQYGWNDGEAGTIQLVVLIGGIFGFISDYHQEYLYKRAAMRNNGRAPPEARLYWTAYGGLMFPLATFAFAWTGRPSVPWPVPALFLCIANWGEYAMYSGIFNYLGDAYETYSSSAQAAQSFVRNVLSAVFVLFAYQLYMAMGYPQASTLVASIGSILAAAPILLIRYGAVLRARSKVASAIAEDHR